MNDERFDNAVYHIFLAWHPKDDSDDGKTLHHSTRLIYGAMLLHGALWTDVMEPGCPHALQLAFPSYLDLGGSTTTTDFIHGNEACCSAALDRSRSTAPTRSLFL